MQNKIWFWKYLFGWWENHRFLRFHRDTVFFKPAQRFVDFFSQSNKLSVPVTRFIKWNGKNNCGKTGDKWNEFKIYHARNRNVPALHRRSNLQRLFPGKACDGRLTTLNVSIAVDILRKIREPLPGFKPAKTIQSILSLPPLLLYNYAWSLSASLI